MTLFYDQLKAMILNDQTPEIFRMMAQIYDEQGIIHEKAAGEIYNTMPESEKTRDELIYPHPETKYRKAKRQVFWWDCQKYDLERSATHYQRQIDDRDLTDQQKYDKRQAEEIEQKERELAKLKARRVEELHGH